MLDCFWEKTLRGQNKQLLIQEQVHNEPAKSQNYDKWSGDTDKSCQEQVI